MTSTVWKATSSEATSSDHNASVGRLAGRYRVTTTVAMSTRPTFVYGAKVERSNGVLLFVRMYVRYVNGIGIIECWARHV